MSAKYTNQFYADVLFYAASKLRAKPDDKIRITNFINGIKRQFDSITPTRNTGRCIGIFINNATLQKCVLYRINYEEYALYYFLKFLTLKIAT